ncbi:MAG TPA: exodeoxyribonuclease V subunit gamma, partial [Myxococcales bacterium]
DGIAANFEVLLLRRFVSGLVAHTDDAPRLVDSELIQDLVLSVLLDDSRLAHPELALVRGYLKGGGDSADAVDQRRVQLSVQLSRLFEEYGFSRPDMLAAWPRRLSLPEGRWTPTELWQRRLWLEAFGPDALLDQRAAATKTRFRTLAQVLTQLPADALAGGRPVFLFGVSYVAAVFQQVLARIARGGELFVYTLNPCMEFWEDLQTGRELARRDQLPHRGQKLDPASLEGDDPFCLKAPGDTPALVLWGRPGRENVRLLDQLSECDFHPAFDEPSPFPKSGDGPGGWGLLGQLQHDILVREPERVSPDPSFDFRQDPSLKLLACPGVRREAEAIAQEIWALIEADSSSDPGQRLRFSDIAVMVAGHKPETHFTHLASAFDERGFEIPYTLEATALASQSRVAEAAVRLLELPFGRFTRAEVLGVVTHPAIASRFPEVDTQEWVRWCDALGIFHGADRADHEGTYLDRDLHNWDQGLRRLALGSVMSCPPPDGAGGAGAFKLDGQEYLPEEHTESAEGNASALGRLVRSLLCDARFLRTQTLKTEDWADLLGRVLTTYLVPQDEGERHDLDKCLAAVRGLAEMTLDGKAVGYRIAGELARTAVEGLTRSSSRHADAGVTLSTLQPMRALPFKVVFVAGLDEGRFPAAERRSELDLRAAKPRAGDVSPREQDQYMFLETLLCARERVVLSYVSRNELTGDPLQPSPVVVELLRMLERGYLPKAKEHLVSTVSLRRFDDPNVASRPTPPEARAEANLRKLRASVEAAHGAQALDRHKLRSLVPAPDVAGLESALRLCAAPAIERSIQSIESMQSIESAETGLGPLDKLGVRQGARQGLSLRVRLSDLKKFLQCPVQGAARFVLRLEEDEEDRSIIEDEPFEAGFLSRINGQRHVLLEWFRSKGGARFEDLAQQWAAPRIAAGELPAGWLWELEKGSLVAGPQVWQKLLEEAGTPLVGLATHGFGSAAESERVDARHDPVLVTLTDGRTAEIVGTTGPIFVEPEREVGGTELSLFQRHRDPERNGLEVARRQHESLGAFIDHLALCAAGLRSEAFISYQLYDHLKRGDTQGYHFEAVAPEAAKAYLAALVEDLQVVSELQLPAVAVFHWQASLAAAARSDKRGWRPTFADSLETVAEKGFLASRYGPVRGVEDFPVPDDARAKELIDRRFGLYLQFSADVELVAKGEQGGR